MERVEKKLLPKYRIECRQKGQGKDYKIYRKELQVKHFKNESWLAKNSNSIQIYNKVEYNSIQGKYFCYLIHL